MIKRILIAALIINIIFPFSIKTFALPELSVSAKSAVLIEAETGKVIYSKNPDQRLPMASTTKIMTALVVLENADLDHEFKVSKIAVGCEGTSAYLCENDLLTISSALHALLLQSANDAAMALAIEVAGNVENFVDLMNNKAKEIGLSNTNFMNPSGLPDEGHYTSARDLVKLSAIALENPEFAKIVKTKSATVKINDTDRTFINHNKLLSLYNDAVGVKTGFTKESGRCLVGAAERDGVRLITVTLSASNDWNDHKNMFDLGFSRLKSYNLYSQNEFIIEIPLIGTNSYISASPKGDKSISLPKGTEITVRIERTSLLQDPFIKGDVVGYAVFFSDGKELCRTPLCALNSSN